MSHQLVFINYLLMKLLEKNPLKNLLLVILTALVAISAIYAVLGDIYALYLLIAQVLIMFLPECFTSEKVSKMVTTACFNLFYGWAVCYFFWTLYHAKMAM